MPHSIKKSKVGPESLNADRKDKKDSQELKTQGGFFVIPFGNENRKTIRKPPARPRLLQKQLPQKRSKVEFVERTIGFGDLDDWNKLPAEDQARIRGHSQQLFKAFAMTKWFLLVLGRFPFKTKKLEDGSFTFTLNYCSFAYAFFFVTTVVITTIFIMFTSGALFIYIDFDSSENHHDRCGNSWGMTILSRNLPVVIFVWSQMMLTAAGSVYIILHGKSFLEFYNVINESVMQLDVDPTEGILFNEIRGNIVFLILFLICFILFAGFGLDTLEDASAFVIQGICYFFWRDVYLVGSKVFTVDDYEALLPKCSNKSLCNGCFKGDANQKSWSSCSKNKCFNLFNSPSKDYKMVEWGGFIIIAYSLLGARALIRQLEFFCNVLVNCASTWNKRFLNYASKDPSIKMDDPFRRRITDSYMMEDHYQIVRLYNVMELNFSFILFVYYVSVFFNLIAQFYYIALLTTQVTCSGAVGREMKAAKAGLCFYQRDPISGEIIDNNEEVLTYGIGPYSRKHLPVVSFEDPCSNQKRIIKNASLAATVLLIVTLTSFVITTIEADRAAHQADIGFYRVRKRGYMSCTTKKQRNMMHALVFSFTGPKKFAITAAGYFPIRKKTIVMIIACAFIYFLIIMSFKPGMIQANSRCYTIRAETVGADEKAEFVVKYAKII